MATRKSTHLTKSKYCAGLQCEKRLWLSVHSRQLAGELDPATKAIFELGSEIGRHAHKLFPGGVLVKETAWQHAQAISRTQALMATASVPAIFEAAFEHKGVRIRADVLERLKGGRWGLREVKMSTGAKDEHLPDIAVQHWVLEGCGLTVPSAELIHVNSSYIRGENGIDWGQFFGRRELINEIQAARALVAEKVAAFHALVAKQKSPRVEPGKHCSTPYECEFADHCQAHLPDDWVCYLPYARQAQVEELLAEGYVSISDIPPDYKLTAVQARVRDAHATGVPYLGPELADALANAGPPARYLDFETMSPAIPLYPGTRPYQAIPFQWSLHRKGPRGKLTHEEFLAGCIEDPRRQFIEQLLAAIGESDEPIHVYSGFERTHLQGLAEHFTDLAPAIQRLCDRLYDLLPIVKAHVYFREFGCSWSIKNVAPALCPSLTYEDLAEIHDGMAAARAIADLATGRMTGADAERTRQSLLEYCKRDTLAMVELHRTLRELVSSRASS